MKKSKEVLKSYFQAGDKPTQVQFEDLIDSLVHQDDETKIYISKVEINDRGDTLVGLSNRGSITVPKPKISQDNKIRVIDLGDVRLFPGHSEGGRREINIARPIEGGVMGPLPIGGIVRGVEKLLVNILNKSNPPITILEDEIVIFEYNLVEQMQS